MWSQNSDMHCACGYRSQNWRKAFIKGSVYPLHFAFYEKRSATFKSLPKALNCTRPATPHMMRDELKYELEMVQMNKRSTIYVSIFVVIGQAGFISEYIFQFWSSFPLPSIKLDKARSKHEAASYVFLCQFCHVCQSWEKSDSRRSTKLPTSCNTPA